MTWLGVVGHALVAFGPLTALGALVVARRSHLSIVAVAAAFFWMLSGVVSAVLWVAVPALKTEWFWVVPSGVLIHEAMRWLFFVCYKRAENAINLALDGDRGAAAAVAAAAAAPGKAAPLTDLSSSLSAGVGHGLMQAVIVFGSVLENGFGDGTYFTATCSSMSLFTLLPFTVCFISVMQVAWMILAFDGYRHGSPVRVVGLLALHMGSSLTTVMNQRQDLCGGGLAVQAALMCASVGAAWLSRVKLPKVVRQVD